MHVAESSTSKMTTHRVCVSPVTSESGSEDGGIKMNAVSFQDKASAKPDQDEEEIMPPLLEYIDANVMGRNTVFDGPYGQKQVVYCDYTASGKPLKFIEDYIQKYIYAFYANTHTTTTTTSRQTTKFRNDAREIIKKCVNACSDDMVVFVGSGTTSAINKLVHVLEMKDEKAKNTVVFVGPFEHHSNILPWKETGAKIVRIKDNKQGTVNMSMLEHELQKYRASHQLIVAFSAASNVTGILTDTVAVAELCHKYGALSFWDYASAGPYITIDMNPSKTSYKDAVFLSPHKFVGGPGTPGVLIAKKSVFQNKIPDGVGGGTVLFVTRDTHLYLKDIEAREEGGTPAIVESIRAGMVFQLKQDVGPTLIEQRETELWRKAFKVWDTNSCLVILGSHLAKRLPIFSFIVYHKDSGKLLHHNFISTLLNDLYGIQARGGCACAGPYAWDLLGVSESLAKKFSWFMQDHQGEKVEAVFDAPLEIMKPGFARINLPYFMDDATVHYVLEAVDMVATHGWKLLPQYHCDPHTGAWTHRSLVDSGAAALYSLNDISYDGDGIHIAAYTCPSSQSEYFDLEKVAKAAIKTFEEAAEINKETSTIGDEVLHFAADDKEKLVWFLQPQEAQIFLAADSLKYKPFQRTTLPFKPRKLSRNYSRPDLQRRLEWQRSVSDSIPEGDENNGKPWTNGPMDNGTNIKRDIITEVTEVKREEKKKKKKQRRAHMSFCKKRHCMPIAGATEEVDDVFDTPADSRHAPGATKKSCVIQ